jgi:hypothetical protein
MQKESENGAGGWWVRMILSTVSQFTQSLFASMVGMIAHHRTDNKRLFTITG